MTDRASSRPPQRAATVRERSVQQTKQRSGRFRTGAARRERFVHTATAISALLLVAAAAPAQQTDNGESTKNEQPTLDELLNVPSEKQLDDKQDATDKAGGKAQPDAGKPADRTKDAVADEPPGDAFARAVADMKRAAVRLRKRGDAGINTQRTQERVIRRLEQLLKQLRRNQKKSSSSQKQQQQGEQGSQKNQSRPSQGQKGRSGSQPMQDSAQTAGRPEQNDAGEPLSEQLSEWGELPPRLRDQLLQGMEDEFSPLYRRLTERYYRRLAEESQ